MSFCNLYQTVIKIEEAASAVYLQCSLPYREHTRLYQPLEARFVMFPDHDNQNPVSHEQLPANQEAAICTSQEHKHSTEPVGRECQVVIAAW